MSDVDRRLRRAVPYPLGYKGIGALGWIRTNNVCVACMALAIGRVKKTFRVRVLKPRDFCQYQKLMPLPFGHDRGAVDGNRTRIGCV